MTEVVVPLVPEQRPARRRLAAPTCLVVLPTYQEAENIQTVLVRLLESPVQPDVLVVDDLSPDGTADLAEAVAASWPGRVHVLRRAGPRGLGHAYRTGFAWAVEHDYELVAQLDADGSHPVDRLPALVAAVVSGADVAIGSRYVDGGGVSDWSRSRQVVSRFGNRFARTLLGLPQSDVTGAYRVWRRGALAATRFAEASASGYGYQVEIAAQMVDAGLAVREVPIVFREREAGSSKMSVGIAWEAMWMVLRLRRRRG